jgi:hypothetical protein
MLHLKSLLARLLAWLYAKPPYSPVNLTPRTLSFEAKGWDGASSLDGWQGKRAMENHMAKQKVGV